jgi:hypothetical protein
VIVELKSITHVFDHPISEATFDDLRVLLDFRFDKGVFWVASLLWDVFIFGSLCFGLPLFL